MHDIIMMLPAKVGRHKTPTAKKTLAGIFFVLLFRRRNHHRLVKNQKDLNYEIILSQLARMTTMKKNKIILSFRY
jgi:hypothetical protein